MMPLRSTEVRSFQKSLPRNFAKKLHFEKSFPVRILIFIILTNISPKTRNDQERDQNLDFPYQIRTSACSIWLLTFKLLQHSYKYTKYLTLIDMRRAISNFKHFLQIVNHKHFSNGADTKGTARRQLLSNTMTTSIHGNCIGPIYQTQSAQHHMRKSYFKQYGVGSRLLGNVRTAVKQGLQLIERCSHWRQNFLLSCMLNLWKKQWIKTPHKSDWSIVWGDMWYAECSSGGVLGRMFWEFYRVR